MKTPPDPHAMSATLASLTGQGVDAIDTPALVLDLDAMERKEGWQLVQILFGDKDPTFVLRRTVVRGKAGA